MKVYVHLLSQSNPIKRDNVINTYTKDGMYCLYLADKRVEKFPLINIFKVEEPYE